MLEVRQIRSAVKISRRQKETLKGLGLNKIGAVARVPNSPASMGMINKVSHLVSWQETKAK